MVTLQDFIHRLKSLNHPTPSFTLAGIGLKFYWGFKRTYPSNKEEEFDNRPVGLFTFIQA